MRDAAAEPFAQRRAQARGNESSGEGSARSLLWGLLRQRLLTLQVSVWVRGSGLTPSPLSAERAGDLTKLPLRSGLREGLLHKVT